MAKVTVDGIPGLDGEYVVDFGYFTNRELHRIKLETGLTLGELYEGFERSDNDAIVAFALVAFWRAGKDGIEPLVWDAKAGEITFDFSDEEQAQADADADPQAAAPTGVAEPVSATDDGPDNGDASSSESLDPSGSVPRRIGMAS